MFGWKGLIRILGALIVSMAIAATAAGYVYVDGDAVGNNDGTSWADAYNYLADALAATTGGEIRVAQGVYKPDQGAGVTPGDMEATFQLKNGVVLKGGYAGYGEADPDARDIELHETILSGDLDENDAVVSSPRDLPGEATREENSYHVATGSGTDETAVLDGFTIVGGNAHDRNGTLNMYDHRIFGGGLYNYSGSPTVTECTFRANSADHSGGGICNRQGSHPAVTRCKFTANGTARKTYTADDPSNGAGAGNLDGSSPTYIGCVFEGNWGLHCGGMSMGWSSSPILERCSFIGNSVELYGGAMGMLYDCDPILNHCQFLGNSSDGGWAGVHNMTRCESRLNNCVFVGNEGDAFINFEGDPTLTNCTLAGNSGKGVRTTRGDVDLVNCIVWGNSGQEISIDNGAVFVRYSDIVMNAGNYSSFVSPSGEVAASGASMASSATASSSSSTTSSIGRELILAITRSGSLRMAISLSSSMSFTRSACSASVREVMSSSILLGILAGRQSTVRVLSSCTSVFSFNFKAGASPTKTMGTSTFISSAICT